ncbi:MAG: hypothetical protein FWF97_03890 [Alphaproteobacteria bacterium]|nr:hypothetical protein [Alphaproteobacteria bacterium]
MKSINKILKIMLCASSIAAFGISDGWGADRVSLSGYEFKGNNICAAKGKTTAAQAPKYGTNTVAASNVEVNCSCKKNGLVGNVAKSYIYPNGQYVALAFPKAARCVTSGTNKWEEVESTLCSGFMEGAFDSATMTSTFDFTKGCWSWKCKEKDWVFTSDKLACEKKDPNLEYSADGIPVFPCDTSSTVTVNGKTVPANTRQNGQCVPTCESDMASSIVTTDPTEFVIVLQK